MTSRALIHSTALASRLALVFAIVSIGACSEAAAPRSYESYDASVAPPSRTPQPVPPGATPPAATPPPSTLPPAPPAPPAPPSSPPPSSGGTCLPATITCLDACADEACAERCFATDPTCRTCLESGGDCGLGGSGTTPPPSSGGSCDALEAAIETCIEMNACMDDACVESRCASQIAAAEACWSGSDPGTPPGTPPPSGGSCDALDAAVETCIESSGCTDDDCIWERCGAQIDASDACWAGMEGGGSDPGTGTGGDCSAQEEAVDRCDAMSGCTDEACFESRCGAQLEALYACYDAGGGGF